MAAVRISPFAALRHRNFRLFYIGQTTSLIGTWMQSLAQGWLVLQLTNSAFWVGLVSALGSIPVLLFSLPAGVFVDRANKLRLVKICQTLYAIEAALLTVLVALGVIRAWQVAALAAVVGAIATVEIPARQALIVELVGRDDLTNAIALNSSAFNATRILGPTAAGLLVAHVGMAACFGINAVSYIAVLVSLFMMRLPPWERAAPSAGGVAQIVEGMRFVRGNSSVFALVVNTAALSIFGFPFLVLLPVFARDLDVGAQGLGVMTACIGIGAVVSALGVAAVGNRVRRGAMVAWAGPIFGLTVAGFAYAGWYWVALVVLGLAGFAMVLNNAATNSLLQALTPDPLRGRVMSIWSLLNVGFAPIGSLGLGALAERIGADAALALGGAVCAIISIAMWTRWSPEVARLR